METQTIQEEINEAQDLINRFQDDLNEVNDRISELLLLKDISMGAIANLNEILDILNAEEDKTQPLSDEKGLQINAISDARREWEDDMIAKINGINEMYD